MFYFIFPSTTLHLHGSRFMSYRYNLRRRRRLYPYHSSPTANNIAVRGFVCKHDEDRDQRQNSKWFAINAKKNWA